MRYLLIIFGIFIFSNLFSQTESGYYDIELAYLNKQYDSVLVFSEQLLSKDSLNWKAYFYRGKAFSGKNKYFKALEVFEKAQTRDSANALIGNSLAEIYDFIGRDEDAIAIYYNQYLRDTMKMEPIVNLANIFRKKREYGSAIFYYQRAVELDPENFYYYKQLAFCYDKINIPDGSIEYYNVALRMNPYDVMMYVQLANILNSGRDFKSALEVCEQGLSYYKDEHQLLKLKAYSLYLNKNFDASIVEFNNLLEKGDSSFFNLKYQGLAYYEKKNFENAIQSLKKAKEYNDQDPETLFYLGSAHARDGNAEQGVFNLYRSKRLLDPSPKEISNIYSEIAFAYQEQEKYKLALEFLKKAYKAESSPILAFKMAQVNDYFLNDKKLAIDYYEGYLTMSNTPDSLLLDSNSRIKSSYADSAMVENAKSRIRILKEEMFFEYVK